VTARRAVIVEGMTDTTWIGLRMDEYDGVLGPFWAPAIGGELSPDDAEIVGPPGGGLVLDRVVEPKTVKHRVHLDIYARTLEELEARGATRLQAFPKWTVMADPEGGEFCAFLREEPPPYRLHGLVVDSANPQEIAAWWGQPFGVEPHDNEGGGWSTLEGIPGNPVTTMDFVPVPEPKTARNRVRWDVRADPDELVAAGARIVGEAYGGIELADPEGNEFIVAI